MDVSDLEASGPEDEEAAPPAAPLTARSTARYQWKQTPSPRHQHSAQGAVSRTPHTPLTTPARNVYALMCQNLADISQMLAAWGLIPAYGGAGCMPYLVWSFLH